jgi:hypothetical protein
MSDISQKPVLGMNFDTNAPTPPQRSGPDQDKPAGSSAIARLLAIGDLVRSGQYEVPAAAIAESIVQRMTNCAASG